MKLKSTIAKGTTFDKKTLLTNLEWMDNGQIHEALNLSLKTMRTYYALENKGIRIDCDNNKAEFDGVALIALHTANEYLRRSGKEDKDIEALFSKFNTNSEGGFEINESMENIFGVISKIDKEAYPVEGYTGVSLQPKSWESFSLNSGRKLIDLLTDPEEYKAKKQRNIDFQMEQVADYIEEQSRGYDTVGFRARGVGER